MKHRPIALAGLLLCLTACGGQPDQAPAASKPPASVPEKPAMAAAPEPATSERYAAGQLSGVVDTYARESAARNLDFASLGPGQKQRQLELEQKYLAAVRAVDRQVLTGEDSLTYEKFEQERLDAIRVLETGTGR